MSEYTIAMPSKVYAGIDSIKKIEEIIAKEKVNTVLLMTDKGVLGTGMIDGPLNIIKAAGAKVEVMSDVPPEPEKNQVLDLLAEAKSVNPQLIVAIGGGSVMDAAKIISVLLKNDEYAQDILDASKIEQAGVSTVMVPTSSGTGSEATPNSIVVVPEQELKIGIVTDRFIPQYVILDPNMTKSLPPHITAATGLDAFCHCIECFISKKANPISDTFALKGIELISKYIRRAYKDGSDLLARENMLLAAFYGGLSIASSSTVAVHALSYPLGGKYRIPHGVSNAMILPFVMEYNKDTVLDKFGVVAPLMGIDIKGKSEEEIGDCVVEEIFNLVRDLEISTDLTKYGIQRGDIHTLVEAATKVTRLLNNNPKEMSYADIQGVYERLF